MAKMNFLKRVHGTPKMRAIKKKISANESARKKLSRTYRALTKSESKRLAKTVKGKKKKTVKRKRR